jgi:hypothetical protein
MVIRLKAGPKPTASVSNDVVEEVATPAYIKVNAAPNPSCNRFMVTICVNSEKPVQIRVINVLGSVIEQRTNVVSNSTIQLGSHL